MDITAPSRWKTVEFISDLHLDESDMATFDACLHYLQTTRADAVFILGDLFEVWVGDDAIHADNPFHARCVSALKQAAQRLDLFIMCGNRDFLMGPALMQACKAQALADPSILVFSGQRVVLTHGDALCTEDTDYQAFRKVVRGADWQTEFLAKSLQERQEIARSIRLQSESRKGAGAFYADVDAAAAADLLTACKARLMIHGHTHKPGQHVLPGGGERLVLSDWSLAATPPRADAIRLIARADGGMDRERVQLASAAA